jgi:hypothetical protein
MSMLTPLGTGGRTRRRRRRWPRILLVLVVLALVAGGAYAAWQWWADSDDSDAPAQAAPTEICHTPTVRAPAELLDTGAVTVSVANGTDRAGLAVETADELAARGFVVGEIGNTDGPVKRGIAVVRYQEDDLDAAVTVAAYVPGATLKPVERVTDPELWLGPDFGSAAQAIAGTKDADLASVTMPTLEPVCRTPKP